MVCGAGSSWVKSLDEVAALAVISTFDQGIPAPPTISNRSTSTDAGASHLATSALESFKGRSVRRSSASGSGVMMMLSSSAT